MTIPLFGWSSVSEGSTMPGAPITALEISNQPGRLVLFAADRAGGVYAAWGNPWDGWTGWHSVSEGSTTPGGRVTAVEIPDQPGRFVLLLADPGGGVYSAWGNPWDGWTGWHSVSEGSTTPGAPITAVPISNQPGRFVPFLADPGGGVYSAWGNPWDGWTGWHSVSEGSTMPGAPITAVKEINQPRHLVLFVADRAGGVYTASGNPSDGWTGWTSVSEDNVITTPGASITAVPWTYGEVPNNMALFAADANGEVRTRVRYPPIL
jgi:hypothetical protein